jgi:N-acyl-D-amino-acid deacylase
VCFRGRDGLAKPARPRPSKATDAALEEAVRKMTSLPAARMHLDDRGILRPGMAADVVAFNPETVRERSTYADPIHYSEGFDFVMVNGQLVVDGGRITGARPGRPLLGPGARH